MEYMTTLKKNNRNDMYYYNAVIYLWNIAFDAILPGENNKEIGHR